MTVKIFLPLFPLRLVVFPGEKLNLHIFEPRYKQLIHECDKDKITFGINAFVSDKMVPIGTEIKLLSISKHYENGEMDICTEGVGLYEIEKFYKEPHGKLYDGADVRLLDLKDDTIDLMVSQRILDYAHEIFLLLNLNKELPSKAADVNTFKLGHYVGMGIDQEYELLCLPTEFERQSFILQHLEHILPVVREMEHLRQRALLNGHFKNIVPPKID
jgi:ATP-dependent Lon protease